MKTVFALIILIHGLIHLLGFFKAFDLFPVHQLRGEISRPNGLLWLVTALLLVLTVVLFTLKLNIWWIPGMTAVVLSQYLILTAWQDAKWGTIANVILLAGSLIGYATWHFHSQFERDVRKTLSVSAASETELLSEEDLAHLPVLVQRYIRLTGAVGKPKVRNFRVEFSGSLRAGPDKPWMPFTSVQYNDLESATRFFFLQATMKHLPVAGYHHFRNGEAVMDIRLFSLIPVQYQSGDTMVISETVTFFNDMCLMAPATLIDSRIEWLEADQNSVKAAFTTGGNRIEAWLHFQEDGRLVNFISEDRFATTDDGTMNQYTWFTPSKEYAQINSYFLSTSADAVYAYPDGDFVYGTFNMTDVDYNVDP